MAPTAGVVQWQNTSFPSLIRGFDSPHPLYRDLPFSPRRLTDGGTLIGPPSMPLPQTGSRPNSAPGLERSRFDSPHPLQHLPPRVLTAIAKAPVGKSGVSDPSPLVGEVREEQSDEGDGGFLSLPPPARSAR